MCVNIKNISNDLSQYYRHVNIFADSLLRQINVTDTDIQSALTNSISQNDLFEQRIFDKISVIIIIWKKKYVLLEDLEVLIINRVRESRNRVDVFRTLLKNVRQKTLRAKTNVIKQWSLSRRWDRYVDLLRVESEELYSYNDVIDTLNQFCKKIEILEQFFTTTWNNITDINKRLRDLAASKLFVDI